MSRAEDNWNTNKLRNQNGEEKCAHLPPCLNLPFFAHLYTVSPAALKMLPALVSQTANTFIFRRGDWSFAFLALPDLRRVGSQMPSHCVRSSFSWLASLLRIHLILLSVFASCIILLAFLLHFHLCPNMAWLRGASSSWLHLLLLFGFFVSLFLLALRSSPSPSLESVVSIRRVTEAINCGIN